ncbi:MAG: gluconeogenesis factor YvcK family protein [Candidatus Beckwithbacteria bacterium]
MPKKIVCLGGGNAMPKAVLTGLKNYSVNLSVISAVLDLGGSAGRLRQSFNTKISFGDIRRASLALSEADAATKNYFNYRDWDGHVVANVFCTAMFVATNSQETAINKLNERLKVPKQHQILPATIDDTNIYAVLENGKVIEGESNIDVPKHNGKLKIKEVYLKPEAKVYPKAQESIKNADLIVIGPGDLYSSLAHILLVKGIPEAIKKSKAKKIYICNLMTKHGETNNFTVSDFTLEIEKLLNGKVDFVIYNTKNPGSQRLAKYKKEHRELLELVENKTSDLRFIGTDLISFFGPVVHDSNKLAKAIFSTCKQ